MKKNTGILLLILILCSLPYSAGFCFGFWAHRKINRMAVFPLPPEMIGFFKKHIEYLCDRSVDPDKRAYAVQGEAPRHYIDIEKFGPAPFNNIPQRWNMAVEAYSADSLYSYGVLPWHIYTMLGRLTNAFRDKNIDRILYNAAHLGHYVSDACTPLHTTMYYNGKTPDHKGIHALWESRIPELLGEDFCFLVGRAEYIENPHFYIWELIEDSHNKVDTIFAAFDKIRIQYFPDLIFSYETRGNITVKVFSKDFTTAFHNEMNLMVEQQMQLAVKATANLWYTAWVNAGQPDLYQLEHKAISRKHRRLLKEEQKKWESQDIIPEREI